MTQPLQRLSTKYALFIAALLSLLMLLTLSLSSYFVFENTNRLRSELTDSYAAIQTTTDVKVLRASGAYLSSRLFNPLFNMDISALNEEIEQIYTWLEPQSILILDTARKVVTDGSKVNALYGQQQVLPVGLNKETPIVEDVPDGRALFFTVAQGDEVAGHVRIQLSDESRQAFLTSLHDNVQTTWERFEHAFLTVIFISVLIIASLSLLLGMWFSATLSHPLRKMTHAAEQYASGNLTHKLPEWSDDELGRLARSLNSMASDLKKADLLLTRAQEIASFGSWEWRRGQDELILSHGVYRIFGVSATAFRPTVKNIIKFVAKDDRERLFAILQGHFDQFVSAEFEVLTSDGNRLTLLIRGEPVKNGEVEISGIVGTMQDITEQRRSQAQLMQLANYDQLTNLPNRNLFYDRLRQAIKNAKRQSKKVALIFLDLDRFKAINDGLGHDIGDELLRQVARRLESIIRESDTLARMGGDEFTLIVESVTSNVGIQRIAQNIIEVLTPVFRIADRDLFISASVGIAQFPKDADQVDKLIKNADTAMYKAKEEGRATFHFFTPELDELAHKRVALEHELRQAMNKGELELHYQPQIRSNGGKLVGFEALLRWRQQNKLHTPELFIPLMEESGLITGITDWVLREACAAVYRLSNYGIQKIRVSVNLCAAQFQQPNLLSLIDEVLTEFALEHEQLELEITESTLLDRDLCQSISAQLATRGVRLAIDDFGVGYSSLIYLKRFHVDTLKIDRSFVKDMLDDPEDSQITSTLVALAQGLKIDCVAEGVETLAQMERLHAYGCDLLQGYLICRPLAIDELITWSENQIKFDTGCYWQGRSRA